MSVGVVTPFFDYFGNPRRVSNYVRHRESISRTGVSHVTVEIQLPDRDFVLPASEDVVQLRTDAPKWHKTNCINIGARALIERGCKYIVWVDGDCIMPSENWADQTAEMLKKYDLLHLQSEIRLVERPEVRRRGVVAGGTIGVDGGAWAARAEFFEGLGHFECIVSGANKAVLTPLCSQFWRNGRIAYAYALDRYAEKASRFIRSVTFLPLTVYEMNHGNRPARAGLATPRFEMLKALEFDFNRDCAFDENGVIRWTDGGSAVAQAVRQYTCGRESM